MVVAEDIRVERSGQHTIVGAFGSRLATTDAKLVMPRLIFRIEIEPFEAFTGNCHFSLVSPSKATVFSNPQSISMPFNPEKANVFAVGWGPVEFTESGEYEVRFGVNEQTPKKVASLRVFLNRTQEQATT